MKTFIIAFFFILNSLYAITFEEVREIEKEHGALKALGFYKELAKNDDIPSLLRLAKIYANAIEVEKSYTSSFNYLKKAAKLNSPKAHYFMGKMQLYKKSPYYDLTDAYNSFVKASKLNYAPAQNILGQFLVNGIVVKKDYKMALNYFEKASKQGLIEAHCNLAFMYASGKGVFPNFGRAHAFAKEGKKLGYKRCIKVWNDFNLKKYPEDKGWKFKFYNKPE